MKKFLIQIKKKSLLTLEQKTIVEQRLKEPFVFASKEEVARVFSKY